MSSSHGFWSLGGFVGGGAGGIVIQNYGHLAACDVRDGDRPCGLRCGVAATSIAEERAGRARASSNSRCPNPPVYLVGLMALLTMISEGAVLDWAALYLHQDSAPTLPSPASPSPFSGAMAVMRSSATACATASAR